jgi:hypothetical protein
MFHRRITGVCEVLKLSGSQGIGLNEVLGVDAYFDSFRQLYLLGETQKRQYWQP